MQLLKNPCLGFWKQKTYLFHDAKTNFNKRNAEFYRNSLELGKEKIPVTE